MQRVYSSIRDVLKRFSLTKKWHMELEGAEKDVGEPPAKRTRADDIKWMRNKKMALYVSYIGQGYSGMQRNDGVKSIEEDLLNALVEIGAIMDDHRKHTDKIRFQRCSRTDKGVSAAINVVSLKMAMTQDRLKQLNECLPDKIEAIGFLRTTRSFDAKLACTARSYGYLTPTFAFAPTHAKTRRDFRMTDDIRARVQSLLTRFTGTHKFHNFTSRKGPADDSAQRYITNFTCGEPFVRNDVEFVMLLVRGQSFLLHQIRKMIGLVIAVVQGHTSDEAIDRAWKPEKMDVPRAPALGLFLNQPYYDFYNKKYGNDGVHQPIDFDLYKERIEAFKAKIHDVIVKTELRENSMMHWLDTLGLHTYVDGEGTKDEGVKEKTEVQENDEKAISQDEGVEEKADVEDNVDDEKAISQEEEEEEGVEEKAEVQENVDEKAMSQVSHEKGDSEAKQME
ncbi:pseudouridylate synthase 1 homolog [Oscarella lobularis]|uniref:pseudouridylate synthase 1 homolog n=1 Tax=Oscarella lobularis TaxID=121494 RepID=UPI0033131F18